MRHVVPDVSDGIVMASWAIIASYWLVARRRRDGDVVKAQLGNDTASRAAGALAAIIVLSPASLWQPLAVHALWLQIAGSVLLVPCAGITIWSRRTLGSMWASGAVIRDGHVLRTSGAYRLTRHPVYSCVLATLAATALAQGLGRWIALWLVVALALWRKTVLEEQLLERAFPVDYGRYRQSVPRLLPLPRPRRAGSP